MKLSQVWQTLGYPTDMDGMTPGQILAYKNKMLGVSSYQELEMDSPFVDSHKDISVGPDAIHLHSHTFFEILYCRTGNIDYLIEDKRYQVGPGDIVYVPPGISHQPIFPKQMEIPYRRYVIWASPAFSKSFLTLMPELEPVVSDYGVLHTTGTKWAYLHDLFRRGYQVAAEKKDGWQAWLVGNTIQLMVAMVQAYRDWSPETALYPHQDIFDSAVNYIESHFTEKITLESTAHHLLISQSALSQQFQQRTGISFYKFVTLRRLVASKNLILQGVPLAQIGQQVGYGDYSNFYRAFRQEYGISPSEFKKLYG